MSIGSFLKRVLKQKAIYWGSPTADGYGGWTFADPVEIVCRWEDQNEVFQDAQGKEQVARSIVYVNTDLDENGYLKLAELDSLSSAENDTNPLELDDTHQIKRIDKLPALHRTEEYLRKVYLSRFTT